MYTKFILSILFIAGVCILVLILKAYIYFPNDRGSFTPISTASSKKLSREQYNNLKQEITTIILKQNPRVAIQTLKDKMDRDPKVLASCHEMLHEMGIISYRKYKDFGKAVSYKDEICVSGYIHGVIEAYFSSTTDLYKAMKSLCTNYRNGSYERWECFHGLGHGLMYYSTNNLPFSLQKCGIVSNETDKGACEDGVYMENFNTDATYHPSKFVSSTDPFFSCRTYPQNQPSCYFNAPIYFLNNRGNDYDGLFHWCDVTPSQFILNCYTGAGAQIVRRNFNNPQMVEKLCMQLPTDKKLACLRGIPSWYIGHYASLSPAQKMCTKLRYKENKALCNEIVDSFKTSFSTNPIK
jgi:hypothetical protein